MNSAEILEANQCLQALRGSNLQAIGRAANLVWLVFINNENEYALHLQTGFRIIVDESIFLADQDIYWPSVAMRESNEFDWDLFDWDVQGNNRFDELALTFNNKNELKLVVLEVTVGKHGDLIVLMSEAVRLEVFATSRENECWRFFKMSEESHLVITGQGIEP
jgi:hypothetical protein